MAPGAAVQPPMEELSEEEVRELLERAGLGKDVAIQGHGGFASVATVAVFASLGGMLFGLDIGYIAGVKSMDSFERDVLGGRHITNEEDSGITMIFGLGAAISAFPPIISAAVGRLGRKGSVISGGFVFCIGALMQGVATKLSFMMVGRLVAGVSVGLLSANVPVYQSEVAPPKHRGMLVSVYQLAVTVGIMAAFLLALLLERVQEPIGGWRWVIFAQLVPGLFLILGGLFMGESPRWLVSKGLPQKAMAALCAVRAPSDDVRAELAEMCSEHERERAMGEPSWREFFSGNNLKLLAIGVTLQLLQQMCGMNAYMYDGPVIFGKLFKSPHAGRLFTAVSGAFNIVSTLPAIFLVDRAGRMVLLKFSALGMTVCSAVLAGVGTACFPDRHCQHWSSGAGGCGAGAMLAGGKLTLGAAVEAGGLEEPACGDWAKWTTTAAICMFIFSFGCGWGPVVWTYCAEMFPMRYRTKAVGATTDANWIGNMFIAFAPPLLLGSIGFNTFWVFAGLNLAGFTLASALPETKDKSLEEVQHTFELWFRRDGKGYQETSTETGCGTTEAP